MLPAFWDDYSKVTDVFRTETGLTVSLMIWYQMNIDSNG